MATIVPALNSDDKGVLIATWTNLVNATSDVGRGVFVGNFPEKTIQAIGTNATTVVIQGSNDGTNWNTLGAGLTLTVGATGSSPVTRIPENPLYIRPSTPSAGADTDVILVAARR